MPEAVSFTFAYLGDAFVQSNIKVRVREDGQTVSLEQLGLRDTLCPIGTWAHGAGSKTKWASLVLFRL